MLDLRKIQENKEKITELLARKGYKADFDPILALDEQRRKVIGEVEQYKAGNERLFGFFVGQVMKATGGKINPHTAVISCKIKLDEIVAIN